jgi:hypothetical protein
VSIRRPDLEVANRRAWRLDLDKAQGPDQSACVSEWLVNGPFHPFWTYWLVGAVHLRPIEGATQAPVINVPGASHEFLILSLDSPPAGAVRPDPDDFKTFRILEPPDFVQQQIGLTDGQAIDITEQIVRAIVVLGWSPDSDYRRRWDETVAKTAEHARLGGHPPEVTE